MSSPISFTISAPNPHDHLLAVTMRLADIGGADTVDLSMPVWTPGSYMVREYSRHVQNFQVHDQEGRPRAAEKIDKATWRVDVAGCKAVDVTYQVYAHELSPRHNHLDGSHGFFNCVATCLYPVGGLDQPVELEVVVPDGFGWEVFCPLEPAKDDARELPRRFVASDFDELFDTPVEMGDHQWFDFEVKGVPHRFVIWGAREIDLEALRRDLPPIVNRNVEMFREIPYDRYLFINHVARDIWGGLEHRHSSVNIFGPENFDDTEVKEDGDYGDRYANLLRLWSHEHFHAYHIKRLRPVELGPFDYQRENYSRSLWAVEGVASYFDTYQLRRAGLIGPGRYMELLEKRIAQLHKVPGRLMQSLEDASFDAWIGLYRSYEHTRNASVSYYLKGELVTWLIDLWIREQTKGERTMADVLRRMWRQYYRGGDVGFPRGAVEEAVAAEAEASPEEIFDDLVRGTNQIDWERYLGGTGLALEASGGGQGWLGVETKERVGERQEVTFVAAGGPAESVGLYPGDELVAIDQWSVRGEKLEELMKRHAPGKKVTIHVLRRGLLRDVEVVCGEKPADTFSLKRQEDATPEQVRLLGGWLGTTEWSER